MEVSSPEVFKSFFLKKLRGQTMAFAKHRGILSSRVKQRRLLQQFVLRVTEMCISITDSAILTRATNDITSAFSTTSAAGCWRPFTATWVFIATWYQVTYYRYGSTTYAPNDAVTLVSNYT